MKDAKNFRKVLNYLPSGLSESLEKMPLSVAKQVNEIRLRVNRPLTVCMPGENRFVTQNGSLTLSESLGVICTYEDIQTSFRAICDYSVHSYQKEISQGYITIEGGNRVGICGTAVENGREIETLNYINSLNFRIAGEIIGCGEEICNRLFSGQLSGVLIIGEPLSGKTTILRDICRILGNRHTVSIVDERSEIAACHCGKPQNDIGFFTDVLNGYNKKTGIETAVRVMSPKIVVCDEIGGKSDCEAVLSTVNSGVKFIASVHGRTIDEVLKREHIKKLVDYGVFENAVLLGSGSVTGKVIEIRKIGGV